MFRTIYLYSDYHYLNLGKFRIENYRYFRTGMLQNFYFISQNFAVLVEFRQIKLITLRDKKQYWYW
jgi:hypothetical protein